LRENVEALAEIPSWREKNGRLEKWIVEALAEIPLLREKNGIVERRKIFVSYFGNKNLVELAGQPGC